MTTVRHAFESAKDDPADATLIGATEWNDTAAHVIEVSEPPPSQHVSQTGDDAFNGSWDMPKATVAAAIDALPAYVAGAGGGLVILGPGTHDLDVDETVSLTSGVTLRGQGMAATILRGNVAGPVIETPSGGGSDPISGYQGIEDMFVWNQSTASGARCLDIVQAAHFHAKRVHIQNAGAGNIMGRFYLSILSSLENCRAGGVAGADLGWLVESCNVIRMDRSSFTDSKGGLRVLGGTAFHLGEECHFESLAGGLSGYVAACSISGVVGGSIDASYWETCASSALAFYTAIGVSHSFVIGGLFVTNCGSPMMDIAGLADSEIGPNTFIPGAISANANGLVGTDAACINNRVARQRLTSGSGTACSITSGNNELYPVGTTQLRTDRQFEVDGDFVVRNTAKKMYFGPAPFDTSFYRTEAAHLKTESRLDALRVETTPATNDGSTTGFDMASAGDAWARFVVSSDGKLKLGAGAISADVNLYRGAADVLQTDDSFKALVLAVTGLAGASTASRFVGGMASGAPTTGTFAVNDWVTAADGHIFICTVAGTPGTWVDVATGVGKYVAGAGKTNLADGDFTVTPANGATGVAHNTTDGKSYYCARANGTWKSVEVTA